MGGNIGLIVLNLVLFAMLVLGWQLWRQSVPKRRKVNTAEVADWPSGATTSADLSASQPANVDHVAQTHVAQAQVAPDPIAAGHVAPTPVPQLVGADASTSSSGFAAPGASVMTAPPVAPVAPAPVETPPSAFAAPMQAGVVDDDELAALLDSAPPTAVAPVPPATHAPAAPVEPGSPTAPASLFTSPVPAAPVSSLAPPVAPAPHALHDEPMGDEVSRQVSALLAAPSGPVQSVVAPPPAPTPAPVSSLPPLASSSGTSDRLRIDITGRPVDDVMRSLATRLGEMSYGATSGPLGETVFQRGASESIRISVSAQEMSSTDADGRPLPGRADIEVVGGQLQETTEAVLFELLDHGFQLRWAVAGELVLSSFDGALARVNVNPTASA